MYLVSKTQVFLRNMYSYTYILASQPGIIAIFQHATSKLLGLAICFQLLLQYGFYSCTWTTIYKHCVHILVFDVAPVRFYQSSFIILLCLE